MAKFFPLKVKDVRRETADAVSIAFEVPIDLREQYQFVQGQYLTLRMQHNGEEIRRSYSLCSAANDANDLRIAAKQVKDGRMSVFLNQSMKIGDVVDVMTPMGNFYSLKSTNNKHLVLFAGGSGITPMLSIIQTILPSDQSAKITLVYANSDESSIIFRDQLKALETQYPQQFNQILILDKPSTQMAELYTGIMTVEKVLALVENHVSLNDNQEFFICGPSPMMKNVESALTQLKIAKEHIHLEYFTASLEQGNETIAANTAVQVTAQVTILMDGDETNFELATDGKTILDAAMDHDVDVPFSCKGAVCCTCRAKVIEGTVHMKANYALTEEEVAEGFILTCQAHPTSARVIVDYDV